MSCIIKSPKPNFPKLLLQNLQFFYIAKPIWQHRMGIPSPCSPVITPSRHLHSFSRLDLLSPVITVIDTRPLSAMSIVHVTPMPQRRHSIATVDLLGDHHCRTFSTHHPLYLGTHGVASFPRRSSTTSGWHPLCLHHRCQFQSTIPAIPLLIHLLIPTVF